jgi:hypothetical protein
MRLATMMVIASIALVGCGTTWQQGYTSAYEENTPPAASQCESYGQEYMTHYYNTQDGNWHVLCKQESPVRLIDKAVVQHA